jgi:UDP-N-acetylglucosamine--N-acetylmuramyl-(pentapeptide) pyrophosphoryl-undecaprenol N-acetylglucosamine transferase
VLLVMGGSQGAQAINRLFLFGCAGLPEAERRRWQVIHLAGAQHAGQVQAEYDRLKMRARVFAFLREMEWALAAADLAVSRAGATGIAEMVAFRLPAILIPYPHAGAHQLANAEWMRALGGARLLPEPGLTAEQLRQEIQTLLADPARLTQMRQALSACSDGSAADRLAELVQRIVACRRTGRRAA